MPDDARHDPLGDVITLLAAPIAGGIRSVDQFRKGVDDLFRAVDNLNRTMENLNDTASRVNRLVADVEEPIRAMIPPLTRSIRAADQMTSKLEAPVAAAAPNIELIVKTLSSPGFRRLPDQLGEIAKTFGEMSKRLGPLTQFAESAGGLFGGMRLPGMGGAAKTGATPPPTPKPASAPEAPADTPSAPAKSATVEKRATKKSTAKKSATKKSAAKKSAAKKKPAAKKAATRKRAAEN